MRNFLFNGLIAATLSLGAYETVSNEAKTQILTPDLKARTIEKIKLSNGLEAVIVSDPTTPESAAVITVKVGSWHEPKPGLAHFLEHMLFLGTEKYPSESSFDEAIGQYKGTFNAFTSTDFTSYFFSVSNAGFLDVLDRFSQFFVSPLFNPDGIDRELNAIDQEFRKNLDIDSYRELEILRQEATASHPFHSFTSGNLISLKGASQEELKQFYKDAYSSDRMRLYLLSPLPIDELKKIAEEKFGQVPKSDKPLPSIPADLFSRLQGKLITYEPVQSRTVLSLLWEINPSNRESKPFEILAHILGNEGKNSLSQILKSENLASSVLVGAFPLSETEGLFQIEVELTANGLKNKNRVLGIIFGAIDTLKNKGIEKSIVEEVALAKKINYENQNRDDVSTEAKEVASLLPYENVSSFPEKSFLIEKIDLEAVLSSLDSILPSKTVAFLAAPKKDTLQDYNKTEQWTQTPYRIDPLPLQSISSSFSLPTANRFLPHSFDLLQSEFVEYKGVPDAKIIADDKNGRLFFWSDNIYASPEVYGAFEIRSSAFQYRKAKNQVLADLLLKILNYNLLALINEASLAGTELSLTSNPRGLAITISGYSDPSQTILKQVSDELHQLSFTPDIFESQLEELKKDYQNSLSSPPYEQITTYLTEDILGEASIRQKVQAAKKVTLADFNTFLNSFFERAYVESLLIGNLNEKKALELATPFFELSKRGFPLKDQKRPTVRDFSKGPFLIEHKIKGENSVLTLAIEFKPFSASNRSIQQILAMGLSDAYFKKLRTEQQTGYVVTSFSDDVFQHLFYFFAIQSSTHHPLELLYRTESFLENYSKNLRSEIPKERFEQMKASLRKSLSDKPQNLEALGELYFRFIRDFNGNFRWLDERIASLDNLDYETFIQEAQKSISRQNPNRVALLLNASQSTSMKYTTLKGKP